MILNILSRVISNKYFSNTSWLLAEKAIQMLVTLYVGIMLAVYMSEADWGFYNWAMSLIIIFSELAKVGLPSIVVKFLVNKDHKESDIMGSALMLKLLGSSFSIGAICALTFLLEENGFHRFLVLMAAIPYLFKSLDVIMYYFEAKVISKYTVIARLSGILANNILKLIIIFWKLPTFYVYFVFLVDALLFVSILILLYKVKGNSIRAWSFNKNVSKALLKSSWPLVITVVVSNLYMRIDQLMIKELLGNVANGNYASAVKLSSAWYALPWIISSSVFPAILNALKKDYQLFKDRFSALYQFLALLAIIVIIPITFFSEEIIAFLYSGKYSEAAEVLRIHIWASIFVFIGYAGNRWLIAENLEKLAFIFTVLGALVNILLNLIIIPKYGINGAAWATLVAQFTTYILMPLFHSKTRTMFGVQLLSLLKSVTIILPLINFYKLLKRN